MQPAYCTILSTNYLPKALALADSLRRHHDAPLKVLFIDARLDSELADHPGIESLSLEVLGLSERDVLELIAGYSLVELATAVKPPLLTALLRDHEQAVYLDPDTYVTSPMDELSPAISAAENGILLTPHFLQPSPPDAAVSDGHALGLGVYNLGFCAVDRRAGELLDWWWGHLRFECLAEPLSGLFVDQKWMDLGSVIFRATGFRHTGYNVGLGNLADRPLAIDDDGYYNAENGERLRLFHFHSFDSSTPELLSTRVENTRSNRLADDSPVLQLCKEYAEVLSGFEQLQPPAPPYPWDHDTRGNHLSRRLCRAHREEVRAGGHPPSPFLETEAAAFARWRRRARRALAKGVVADVAKFTRLGFQDQYAWLTTKHPGVVQGLRRRFADRTGMWG